MGPINETQAVTGGGAKVQFFYYIFRLSAGFGMSIKKDLQSDKWDRFLRQEAEQGNEDAIAILDWIKRNRWLKSQRHLPPKPFLPGENPKVEV